MKFHRFMKIGNLFHKGYGSLFYENHKTAFPIDGKLLLKKARVAFLVTNKINKLLLGRNERKITRTLPTHIHASILKD